MSSLKMILINCLGRTCLEIWCVLKRRQCQMRTPTIISNEGVTKILVCRCRRGGGIDFGGWWYVCPRYSDTTTLWQAHIGGFSDMTRRSDIQQQQEQLYRKDRLEGKHAE